MAKDSFIISRTQEIELPQTLELGFINKNMDYQKGNQYSRRLITRSNNISKVDISIVMDDNAAKNTADKLLYSAWNERLIFEFALPMKYSDLDVGDIITLTASDNSRSYIIRIFDRTDTSEGIKCRGVSTDLGIFSKTETSAQAATSTIAMSVPPSASRIIPMDLSPLSNAGGTDYGVYYVIVTTSENWQGASVYNSTDNINFSLVGSKHNRNTTGYINSNIVLYPEFLQHTTGAHYNPGKGQYNSIDWSTYFTVVLNDNGTSLESIDIDTLLTTEKNTAIIFYNNNYWEIFRFLQAEFVSGTTYRLKGLIRGIANSSILQGNASNTIGSGIFSLLSSNTVGRIDGLNIGTTYYTKAISFNRSKGSSNSVVYSGRNWVPYPVTDVKISRTKNEDIVVNFTRQNRFNNLLLNNSEVPQSDAGAKYLVYLMDLSNTITHAVNTVTASGTTATYSTTFTVSGIKSTEQSSVQNSYLEQRNIKIEATSTAPALASKSGIYYMRLGHVRSDTVPYITAVKQKTPLLFYSFDEHINKNKIYDLTDNGYHCSLIGTVTKDVTYFPGQDSTDDKLGIVYLVNGSFYQTPMFPYAGPFSSMFIRTGSVVGTMNGFKAIPVNTFSTGATLEFVIRNKITWVGEHKWPFLSFFDHASDHSLGNNNLSLEMYTYSSGPYAANFYVRTRQSNVQTVQHIGGFPVTSSDFTHVVIVISSSGLINTYTNGYKISLNKDSGQPYVGELKNFSTVTSNFTNARFYGLPIVGTWWRSLAVYNRPLTSSEISDNYNKFKGA